MPKRSIIPKKNLPILRAFREFFAYKSISKKEIDLSLVKSNLVKTFMICYDCPDIISDLSQFWTKEVVPLCTGNIALETEKFIFEKVISFLYVLVHHNQMNIKISDPTASYKYTVGIQNNRNRLMSESLEDLRVILGIKKGKLCMQSCEFQIPFNIEEIMEDPEEDLNMIEQYLRVNKSTLVEIIDIL